MRNCAYNFRNSNIGHKTSATARSFQISVNHRRQILHSTHGFPGGWTDTTVVRYDEFVTKIHRGELYADVEYVVDGKRYKGVWIACDNGCLNWSATIPPYKSTNSRKEIRWSKWLESMRKDVECTFGILKGRWRILKSGIMQHSFETVDDIWFTCCALHNMLLDVDGLSKQWKEGVSSDYEKSLGLHERQDIERHVPEVFRRLRAVGSNRSHDSSGFGGGGSSVAGDNGSSSVELPTNSPTSGNIKLRQKQSRDTFRTKLVEHFDKEFTAGRVVWPRSNGTGACNE